MTDKTSTADLKVTVSYEPLRQILQAINGPAYLIRELQAIRSLGNSPIDRLIEEFNAEVKRMNEAAGAPAAAGDQ